MSTPDLNDVPGEPDVEGPIDPAIAAADGQQVVAPVPQPDAIGVTVDPDWATGGN